MIQIFTEYYPEHEQLYRDIYRLTQGMRLIYPDYENWYHNTFLEGLKQGTRRYLVSSSHGHITGCCLLKDTPTEKKICTLFVAPEYRGRGIGTELLQTALEDIGDTTIITVSEKNREQMGSLLTKFGFHFSHLFLNGQLEEFEYTYSPKIVAHQNPKIPLAKVKEDLCRH